MRDNFLGGQKHAHTTPVVERAIGSHTRWTGWRGVAAPVEQFLPVLSIRQGTLRFLGIPLANGYIDYLTLLNERDGGINGVKLVWEDGDTVYDVDRSVECFEHLKGKGSTGRRRFIPSARQSPMP